MPIDTDIPAKQREYNIHASKIKTMRAYGLDKRLQPDTLDGKAVAELLAYLRGELPSEMLASIEDNLKHQLGDDDSIKINADSFAKYLSVLPCRKIRQSPISFDGDTGKVAIWYNADPDDHNSVKISLVANRGDFTFSVLSRADGLAVMSGTLRLNDKAHYKIEAFMDTTLETANRDADEVQPTTTQEYSYTVSLADTDYKMSIPKLNNEQLYLFKGIVMGVALTMITKHLASSGLTHNFEDNSVQSILKSMLSGLTEFEKDETLMQHISQITVFDDTGNEHNYSVTIDRVIAS